MSVTRYSIFSLLCCLLAIVGSASLSLAQTTDPTITNPGVAGVLVDATGVLRMQANSDPDGAVTRQRLAAAKASLDPKLAHKSELRKVSLTRLEAALTARLGDQQKATEDMLNLAGLTRIKYVFFYPDSKEIVLAGPAEGYATDISGRVRGLETGVPTLQLDDLVVALRAFFGKKTNNEPLISVSIDPTQEGLQNMKQFLAQYGSRATPADTQTITSGLKESLGLQTVRLTGVPASSHFAQVLVEADYRMKLMGIGLERIPANMQNYVQRANPAAVSKNALARWYFVPDYQCVRVAEDDLAMELVGDGVKLLSSDELVQANGQRVSNNTAVDGASHGFTAAFTKNFAQIANKSPVYWQLRNLIDLSVACAFMREQKYPQQADWKMETLLSEEKYPVETLNVPKQVETAVAALWKGNRLMTPIGGGVHIEPAEALKTENLLADKEGRVAKQREAVNLKSLPANQWWWD